MIFANTDIYEGQFVDDLKEGYGSLTKANGDYFEGFFMKDLKHGQGSYYYGSTNKIYVGEWLEGVPRCGVFTEVEDEEVALNYQPRYFTDPEPALTLPQLQLEHPKEVLRDAILRARDSEETLQQDD